MAPGNKPFISLSQSPLESATNVQGNKVNHQHSGEPLGTEGRGRGRRDARAARAVLLRGGTGLPAGDGARG